MKIKNKFDIGDKPWRIKQVGYSPIEIYKPEKGIIKGMDVRISTIQKITYWISFPSSSNTYLIEEKNLFKTKEETIKAMPKEKKAILKKRYKRTEETIIEYQNQNKALKKEIDKL